MCKWWPYLFKPDMIRAIQDDRKSQTRRVVVGRNSFVDGYAYSKAGWSQLQFDKAWIDPGPSPAGNPGPYLKVPHAANGTVHRVYSRVQVGDRLWIREACRAVELGDGRDGVGYIADGSWCMIENSIEASEKWMDLNAYGGKRGAQVSPIHMPRWASRITLEVTAIRPERIQDISEEDAKAEGAKPIRVVDQFQLRKITSTPRGMIVDGDVTEFHEYYSGGFMVLWDQINEKRGFGWAKNDWVWAYTFKVIP